MLKDVCIIILTYNNASDTLECLHSVDKLVGGPYSVVLVDNGSTDGTIKRVSIAFPDVLIIENKINLGFARGVNKGIIYAYAQGYQHFFLLNNDTVLDKQMMLEALEVERSDPNCGIVMPTILKFPIQAAPFSRKLVWSDGGYQRHFPPTIKLKDDRLKTNPSTPRIIEFAPGCALLINRRTVDQVGLLDPEFFFFFEDWDYSIRVLNADLIIWNAPASIVWHKISQTARKNSNFYWKMMGRSSVYFFRKHFPIIQTILYILIFFVRDFFLKPKKLTTLLSFLSGLKSGIQEAKIPIERTNENV